MHVVTKILIVFGALLAILLAALSMAFAANAGTIRDSIAAETSARIGATNELSLERTRVASELARLKAEKETADNQVSSLTSQISTLMEEANRLKSEVAQSKLEAERAKNLAGAKDSVLQTNTKMVENLIAEADTLRTRALNAAKREAELTERLSELESQNQVLNQNIRAVQEQLAEARNARTTTSPAAASGSASGSATTLPAALTNTGIESFGPLVQGRVRNVTRAENGEDLAFITVGSSSGIKVGQRLHVVRDGRFVASIVITAVDVSEAAGRIDRLGRSIDVRNDDLVLSRVN